MRRILPVIAAVGFLVSPPGATLPRERGLPEALEGYLATITRLSAGDRTRLLDGAAVAKLLPTEEDKEVAVAGAIWIAGPIERYVDFIRNIERFEHGGGYKMTRRVGESPQAGDFSELQLPPRDVQDLRDCRIGSCEIKLDERAIQRLRTEIDWKAADVQAQVDRFMRGVALRYVNDYLGGGNDRLPVYRDKSHPRSVPEEFRSLVTGASELGTLVPDVRGSLLASPRGASNNVLSFVYWQLTEFGLKPTIRISHLTLHSNASATFVVSRMLYATHYFWTALEVRALFPDPARGDGFWFAMVNRSRVDGLSGFTGLFARRRVRGRTLEGTLNGLRTTKRRVETGY